VVQLHNYSLDVAVPASAGAGLWDCSVIYTGLDTSSATGIPVVPAAKPFCGAIAWDHGDLATYKLMNSLTVITDATGVALTPSNTTGVFQGMPSFRSTHQGRLIAVAVEIHNTTAEINRQGSLTVGMLPPSSADVQSITPIDGAGVPYYDKDFQADSTTYFPGVVGDLKSVPQSATWEARKGVYMIPRLSKADIVPTTPTPNRGTICRWRDGTATSGAAITVPQFVEATLNMPYYQGFNPSSFSPMCAFLSGLSNATTLTVTFRCLVEYFPTVSSEMISLTSPSASYDPKAMAAYSAICESAPCAVPVSMNAGGDYFRAILSTVSALGPVVRGFINAGTGALAVLREVRKKAQENKADRQSRKGLITKNGAGSQAMPTRK